MRSMPFVGAAVALLVALTGGGCRWLSSDTGPRVEPESAEARALVDRIGARFRLAAPQRPATPATPGTPAMKDRSTPARSLLPTLSVERVTREAGVLKPGLPAGLLRRSP